MNPETVFHSAIFPQYIAIIILIICTIFMVIGMLGTAVFVADKLSEKKTYKLDGHGYPERKSDE